MESLLKNIKMVFNLIYTQSQKRKIDVWVALRNFKVFSRSENRRKNKNDLFLVFFYVIKNGLSLLYEKKRIQEKWK